MSLGTKIKEALRGPDYSERSQDDIDQRPPGAFPADDVPSSQYTGATDIGHSGSQRNKLHKPDDPRGWGGSEGNNPGHRYTDSGVGLMEHNDPAKLPAQDPMAESAQQMPEPIPSRPHEDKTVGTRAFGLGSSSANDYDQTGSAAAGPGNGAAKSEGISSEPSALAGSGVESQRGDDSMQQSGSHPYWGDIPRGVGVYNTVTGHGSAEDEQHHHNGQHVGGDKGTSTEPAAPGAETSDLTKPEAADLEPVSRDQPGAIHDSTKSSGHGDALPAAGVGAGAAGIAAYEASKRHDEHDTTKDQKSLEGEKKTTPESAEHDEKKGNKLTALFHSSHKDDKSEAEPKEEVITEHRHEKKQHEKHEKDKHPKEEKDSKLAGILHRDHKDEKQPHHQNPEDEAKPRQSEDKYEEHLDEAKAAALAAYAAHEVDDKHHEKAAKHDKDRSAEPDSPKEKKESKLHALFHRSHKDKDSKKAHEEEKEEEKKEKHHHEDRKEPVVVPITQERIPRQDQHRPYEQRRSDAEAAQTQPTQERDSSHWKEGAAAAGAGGAAGYVATKAVEDHREHATTSHPTGPSQPAQPATDFSKPYASQPQQDLSTLSGSTGTAPSAFPETRQPHTTAETSGAPQHDDRHHYGQTAALAGAGAAGAGAAAYYGQKNHQHDTAQPESTATGPTPPPKDTPVPYQQPQQPHSGGAAAATTGTAAAAPFASSHETPVTKADEPKATTATAPAIPSSTQGATETKYNVLPSGTVSGVKVANSSAPQGHQAPPRAANDTFLSNDARPTDKAAVPAPVPAPASATEQRSTKEEAAPAAAAAAAAPVPTQAPDSSNKVIHKCHNCGEDNDITHYFNK